MSSQSYFQSWSNQYLICLTQFRVTVNVLQLIYRFVYTVNVRIFQGKNQMHNWVNYLFVVSVHFCPYMSGRQLGHLRFILTQRHISLINMFMYRYTAFRFDFEELLAFCFLGFYYFLSGLLKLTYKGVLTLIKHLAFSESIYYFVFRLYAICFVLFCFVLFFVFFLFLFLFFCYLLLFFMYLYLYIQHSLVDFRNRT